MEYIVEVKSDTINGVFKIESDTPVGAICQFCEWAEGVETGPMSIVVKPVTHVLG